MSKTALVGGEHVDERRSSEKGQLTMPFYIVCDVSWSMTPDIEALNAALEDLAAEIRTEPAVDDVGRISVLTFSDTAGVAVPLGQVSELRMPRLAAQNGTNYSAAFELLADTIAADVVRLKQEGFRPYRACAFFLTDGEPLDSGWAETFKRKLTYDRTTGVGNRMHPIFVPFGFRDAPEHIMRQLAYPPEKGKWYAARTSNVDDALKGVLDVIMRTVITSSRNGGAGQRGALQLAAPATGAALASGDSEYDEDFA